MAMRDSLVEWRASGSSELLWCYVSPWICGCVGARLELSEAGEGGAGAGGKVVLAVCAVMDGESLKEPSVSPCGDGEVKFLSIAALVWVNYSAFCSGIRISCRY